MSVTQKDVSLENNNFIILDENLTFLNVVEKDNNSNKLSFREPEKETASSPKKPRIDTYVCDEFY